ncbi:HNH endonuclease [Desulfovibrio subterraneus]|uniref:HNH domain-containing protein n=1 Tax=Desulfovibrio subterraneus TaxID=2718620 RepID=A0A7J0BLV2_9BACT|nr:HNH endonuclease [Desulfovibrio subterraneus]GFM34182.1 hypothetical protein DSM101010T_25470 [Desulfovibrio subterraneus]
MDITYPIQSHSWELLSPTVCIKTMDKSAFLYGGSGIPKEICFFFEMTSDQPRREISLIHAGTTFTGSLEPDALDTRVRIFWRGGLDIIIKDYFPSELTRFQEDSPVEHPPLLRFTKGAEPDVFTIELISQELANNTPPVIPEDLEVAIARKEGETSTIVTTVRKRSQANRLAAIKYHGLECVVCGFNFEKFYGPLGQGFIEIHHVNPLHEKDGEREVDPVKDLVPVCSNCHRMLHRTHLTHITIPNILKK